MKETKGRGGKEDGGLWISLSPSPCSCPVVWMQGSGGLWHRCSPRQQYARAHKSTWVAERARKRERKGVRRERGRGRAPPGAPLCNTHAHERVISDWIYAIHHPCLLIHKRYHAICFTLFFRRRERGRRHWHSASVLPPLSWCLMHWMC